MPIQDQKSVTILNESQLSKLRNNNLFARVGDPNVLSTTKPTLAIFAPPVSSALAQIGPNQCVRPDVMLVVYAASLTNQHVVLGLLQSHDRCFTLGWFNLSVIVALFRSEGFSLEALDLADDSPSIERTLAVLSQDALDGFDPEGPLVVRDEIGCGVEIVLTLSSPNTDPNVFRPTLHLEKMDQRRMLEVRPQAAAHLNRNQRRNRWRRR